MGSKIGPIWSILKILSKTLQGKDPLLVNSYRGITVSSVFSKLLEVILNRLSDTLEDLQLPDVLQTAYQKGLSCSDAVFVTQEALLIHLCKNGHLYLCLFDLEKAFNSIELSVLLRNLFNIGINGKCWRIIESWYTAAYSRIHVDGAISNPYLISRGVKQGSVLSPILFLIVIDPLLKTLRDNNAGLSVYGTYIGGAAHADDLRTATATKNSIIQQVDIIEEFTSANHLKLNSSKTEIIKISRNFPDPEPIQVSNWDVTTVASAKCLGVWWQFNLSALRAVQENISKARRAFFALGEIGAFQGSLNPLSASSIYESCVISILLYGCETWLLDSSCILLLDQFQYEIGRRILKLPKHFSGHVVRICLCWPSMSSRILARKLSFLAKLLQSEKSTLSSQMFTSVAIIDAYDVSIIQQCRMLESNIGTRVLKLCLECPEDAISIVH